jgi:hypothetical protein
MYGKTDKSEGRLDNETEDATTHIPTAEFQTLGNLIGLGLCGQALLSRVGAASWFQSSATTPI